MKNNYLERTLSLKANPDELNKLEAFIEKICDDFHVYDAYYGNIVASNNIAFEICMDLKPEKVFYFEIGFCKSPVGMFFTLKIKDIFLDFARNHELIKNKTIEETETLDEGQQKMILLRMLSDNIFLDAEEESVTMVFYITGINEMLTTQRIEMLKKYYKKLKIGVKQ